MHQTALNPTSRLALFFRTLPPWSWADFLGWSIPGILAPLLGLAFYRGIRGMWDKNHRWELVGLLVASFVATGGGVFMTWLFHAFMH